MTLTEESDGVVRIWSQVRVQDRDGEEEFVIVPHAEANATEDKVSEDSPLGHALLGRRAGERVTFRTPGGVVGVTLVKIS